MAELPAINTSPLIFLSQANLLNFLQMLSPKIIVPQAVAAEIQTYGDTDVTAQALVQTDWLIANNFTLVTYNISDRLNLSFIVSDEKH